VELVDGGFVGEAGPDLEAEAEAEADPLLLGLMEDADRARSCLGLGIDEDLAPFALPDLVDELDDER